VNILTFDLEDWFHILDNQSTRTENEWQNFEPRIQGNTDRILEFLQRNNQQATFFCLGWIVKNYPQLIRKISDLGYDMACHSNNHQLIFEQNPKSFRQDLVTAIKTLEDCIGKKVTTYRAPGFSLTNETLWAFEILIEQGITCDSSIFPAQRGHGGFPEIPCSSPFIISINGNELLEFPVNVFPFPGKKIVFSGGGYFRLYPYSFIKYWTNRSQYIMSYFHPRDFDPDQPLIEGLSVVRKFKSYHGLQNSFSKFSRWISDYPFIDLQSAIQKLDTRTLRTLSFSVKKEV
jgi:peptidoglycan-N-acetylglucosamine deacetylase